MANAVAVRSYGDQYQALVFWKYALDMLKKDSDIENIGYEYDEIKSFDDVVIFYKRDQKFRDTTINRAYIQVKFHMKQNNEFTMDNLLDPSFIDAKSVSFLQKVVNAYRKDKEQYSKSVYMIYSTWTIQHTDILNELISNVDNTFDLHKITEGKTARSRMYNLRKKLCTKLSVNEEELMEVLRQLKIKAGQPGFEDLKENINKQLTFCGLKSWHNSKNTFPYCDLIHSLNCRDINLVGREELSTFLKNEELFETKQTEDTVAIKSFVKQTEWLVDWTKNICDLNNVYKRLLMIQKERVKLETGGIIIGYYDEDCRNAIITECTNPPKDSIATRKCFLRGVKGLKSLLKKKWNEKNEYYLGEWHLHPGASPQPSITDIFQMKKIEHNPKFNCQEPILLIVGEKYNNFEISLILFKNNKQYFYIESEP